MPIFRKRNSFSPLKERERRFINSFKGHKIPSINLYNSFRTFDSLISSPINNTPVCEERSLSFRALKQEKGVKKNSFSSKNSENQTPKAFSPGKNSIFKKLLSKENPIENELKLNLEKKNYESLKVTNENLETKSYKFSNESFSESGDDLSSFHNLSHHSETVGNVQSYNFLHSFTERLFIIEIN